MSGLVQDMSGLMASGASAAGSKRSRHGNDEASLSVSDLSNESGYQAGETKGVSRAPPSVAGSRTSARRSVAGSAAARSHHSNNNIANDNASEAGSTSDATARLVSLVQELTNTRVSSSTELEQERERKRQIEAERLRLQEEIRRNLASPPGSVAGGGSQAPSHRSRGGDASVQSGSVRSNRSGRTSRSPDAPGASLTAAAAEWTDQQSQVSRTSSRGSRHSSRHTGDDPSYQSSRMHHSGFNSSRDPDEGTYASRRSGASRSVRKEPDGIAHGFGLDDPDGQHYDQYDRRAQYNNHRGGPPPQAFDDRTYRTGYSEERSQYSRSRYEDDESYQGESIRDSDIDSRSEIRSVPPPAPRLTQDVQSFVDDGSESYHNSQGSTYKSRKAKPLPIKPAGEEKYRAKWWTSFSRAVTCCIPDGLIKREGEDAKQAWREKVALSFIMFMVSAFFVGAFGFIPILLCQETKVYTMKNVEERTSESWIVVHGNVYDMKEVRDLHPPGPAGIDAFMHSDASRMFPRPPPALLPDMCLNKEKFEDNEELQSRVPVCDDFTPEDIEMGLPCHTFATGTNLTAKFLGDYVDGDLAHSGEDLRGEEDTSWVSIHDRVYNVTDYVNSIRNVDTKQIEADHEMAYLEPTLNNLIINKLNEDATELFQSVYADDRVLSCLDELFYVGIVDTRFDPVCFTLNVIMYTLLCFVALMLVAQLCCSLMYLAKNTRTYSEEDTQDQVMIMVPCYNEGGKELIKTIDSVLETTYPEENKVLLVVADGNVTGHGQNMSTPEHLAEILGFEIDPQEDETYEYDSIGLLTTNRARVYHGYYEVEGKDGTIRSLKYIVVVKSGLPMEQTESSKPGNRGKRDSQLIVAGYFNRIYHGRELNELDSAIEDAMIDLNMQSDDLRLLMTIDADTRVEPMSVTHMAYNMNKNDKVLALCGETKVDNKTQSWVTMIQVFEYYNNHHMKKAFESVFGCVTCLPGCFTMYRILNDDGKPLLASDNVYTEYLRNDIESLHEQNLYHLGEDRMLTTLLLYFFPDMQLTYVPEAQCWTTVPHTFRILLSQRRRWINSTFHNLLELVKVKSMCGICCFSMKTIVILDLIACMILPASTLYAAFLLFQFAFGGARLSLLLTILYGLIIGVQLVVFILRARFDFILWFLIFTVLGVPVFYFILPLYAFWHMDDFSWGETRKVQEMLKRNDKG